jgi:hypothetical protein
MDVLEQNRPSRNGQSIEVDNRYKSSIVTITLTNDDDFDVTRTIVVSGRVKIEAHPASIGRTQFQRLHDRLVITPEHDWDPDRSYFDFRFDSNHTRIGGFSICDSQSSSEDCQHPNLRETLSGMSRVESGYWMNGYLTWFYPDISVPGH